MKKLSVLFFLALFLLVSTILISWEPYCDSERCQDAIDKIPKIYCKGCEWSIMTYDYGYCWHGMCRFDIYIWCCDDREYDIMLLCPAECPL